MTTTPTILITGASRGLGLALARGLAQRGWTLLIDARGADALEAARAELARATRVIAVAGDVTSDWHREALAEAAHDLGGLDAIVNNASVLGPSPLPPLLDYPVQKLEEVYRANVLAPLALLQAVRRELKPGARILNITSDAGVEAYPGWGGYGSSKAALEQLSHILAAENPNLRVYWVDPGDMRTQMHQDAFPGEDISDRPLPEESVPGLLELLTGDLPSGRYRARELPQAGAKAAEPQTTGVKELRVALTVDDFDAALALYRDGLGLPTLKDWTNEATGRSIVLGAGAATIELLDHADAAYTDAVEAAGQSSGPVRLAIEVANVDEVSARLRSHGAKSLGDPVHTSWGNYTQRLRAPDGTHLSLYQPDEVVER
ncbi:MAG TPA: SDR family NAD(P)-dependent oxidoreductase [Ktedonobacterales bacterium]|jgi:NAD(P)-dependent dehydrogenase (short-subunit alcohol dehydrogenase family)|nr:SDR family NAD(P)-dependent oxidoreductase [Ktedonobacterales bacterium]